MFGESSGVHMPGKGRRPPRMRCSLGTASKSSEPGVCSGVEPCDRPADFLALQLGPLLKTVRPAASSFELCYNADSLTWQQMSLGIWRSWLPNWRNMASNRFVCRGLHLSSSERHSECCRDVCTAGTEMISSSVRGSAAQTFYAQITSRIIAVVVPAAGNLETCCCVGGRWANREYELRPHVASQDALPSSSMGTISLVSAGSWLGSFTNSSSRSTSNRSTLPSCKSCTCSICLRSIIRVSMSP
jgi:hypothetical protein